MSEYEALTVAENLVGKDKFDIAIALIEAQRAILQDLQKVCELCGASPMTANCNNAGCDK